MLWISLLASAAGRRGDRRNPSALRVDPPAVRTVGCRREPEPRHAERRPNVDPRLQRPRWHVTGKR